MKTHEGAGAYRHSFLTPAIDGCWLITLRSGPLYHGENTPVTNSTVRSVSLKAILDVLEEMLPVEESNQECPVISTYPSHYTE